jgi:ribosomal protein RSM22 (predicted rRNA methylase)
MVCGFTQRLELPSFVRLTQHSKDGYGDIKYSYLVIKRGIRPKPVQATIGRIGEVGRRALEKERRSAKALKELKELNESSDGDVLTVSSECSSLDDDTHSKNFSDEGYNMNQVEEHLRQESYYWPRLVLPPLKRGGHVIIDGCMPEGLSLLPYVYTVVEIPPQAISSV